MGNYARRSKAWSHPEGRAVGRALFLAPLFLAPLFLLASGSSPPCRFCECPDVASRGDKHLCQRYKRNHG